MRKWTAAAVLLVLLLSLLAGCGAKGPNTSLEAILKEIETKLTLTDAVLLDEVDLLDLYGIRSEDLEEFACSTTMNGIFPDEILMFRAKDDASLGRVREKLDARLQEVLNQSKSYDPESYKIAQKCHVDVRGLYIAFFVSAQHEKMTEIYGAHF